MIKAILIDPYARTVTEVEHDPDTASFDGTYKLLSGPPHNVSMIERVFLPNGDMIWIDENANVTGPGEELRHFMIAGWSAPLAGRGLLVGDGGQKDAAPITTLEEAQARVKFAPDCFRPKASANEAVKAHRQSCRDTLREVVMGPDKQFDELASIIALGLQIERMMDGIDGVQEIAEKLGAKAAVAAGATEHRGHHYHVRLERCTACEERDEQEER